MSEEPLLSYQALTGGQHVGHVRFDSVEISVLNLSVDEWTPHSDLRTTASQEREAVPRRARI